VNAIYFLVGAAVALFGVAAYLAVRKPHPREDAKASYIRGLNELLRGDEASAQDWLTRAVRSDTRNVDAYLKLAGIFRARGDLQRALRVERELLVRGTINRAERQEILTSLARSYECLGEWAKAGETLARLVEADGANVAHHRALTRAHEMAGNWDAALESRRELAKIGGEAAEKELAMVTARMAERRWEEGRDRDARRLLREAFRLDPDCPAALLLQGDRAARGGRIEEAARSWRQLAEKRPEWGELAFHRLEQAHYEHGSFERMPEFFQDLIRENPANVAARIHLAEIYHRKGESEEALRVLREGLAVARGGDGAARLSLLLVAILRETGRFREALAEIDRGSWIAGAPKSAFRCANCGESAQEFDWRCARCGEWGTSRVAGLRAMNPPVRLSVRNRRLG